MFFGLWFCAFVFLFALQAVPSRSTRVPLFFYFLVSVLFTVILYLGSGTLATAGPTPVVLNSTTLVIVLLLLSSCTLLYSTSFLQIYSWYSVLLLVLAYLVLIVPLKQFSSCVQSILIILLTY
jgi:hypothetical protein